MSVKIALSLTVDDLNLRGEAAYRAFSYEWCIFLCGTDLVVRLIKLKAIVLSTIVLCHSHEWIYLTDLGRSPVSRVPSGSPLKWYLKQLSWGRSRLGWVLIGQFVRLHPLRTRHIWSLVWLMLIVSLSIESLCVWRMWWHLLAHLWVKKVCFVGAVRRYLLQTSFVVLALSSEHLKLFLQTFQCFFDSLLTFVSFLISGLEIGGQNFTVERKCIELLFLPPESLVKLLDQIVFLLQLTVQLLKVLAMGRLGYRADILTAFICNRISLIDIAIAHVDYILTDAFFLVSRNFAVFWVQLWPRCWAIWQLLVSLVLSVVVIWGLLLRLMHWDRMFNLASFAWDLLDSMRLFGLFIPHFIWCLDFNLVLSSMLVAWRLSWLVKV